MPIDSAQYEVENVALNIFQIFILGEQPEVFETVYPLNNFLTAQPILTGSMPIDTARQVEELTNMKNGPMLILGDLY
jgi:hypothetical protein